MTGPDDRFAGGDRAYLRGEQYATTDRLRARVELHQRFGTAEVSWFEWMTDRIPWQPGPVVEVGCGTGALWNEGRPPVEGPLVLTDLSDAMVRGALHHARRVGYTPSGMVAGVEALPLADGSWAHVIANHMLYHAAVPRQAVGELARIASPEAVVSVATNGAAHLGRLKQIEHEVFGSRLVDRTVEAFGLENGEAMLREVFEEVGLERYADRLVVTDRDAVLAYLCSMPPGEDADPDQLEHLAAVIDAAFVAGSGALHIDKEVGLFVCRGPRRI